jgi:phytoene dehydrogenase-like protein
MRYDAVVIGAGHNGLVAANLLADAGWSVLVVEAQDEPGGAVKSAEVTSPGFVSDLFSGFYPLGYVSPALRALDLESHGVEWCRSRIAVAHPAPDGRCATLSTDIDETAASLDRFAPGDGDAWRELYGLWRRVGASLVDGLMTPFPPVRAGTRIARALGSPQELVGFARFGILPVRRLAEETFRGEGGGWLLAGNALHADLTPESSGGALFGWLLCALGQQVGYPVPRGGAGELTRALTRRLVAAGGELRCSAAAEAIEVRGGRGTAVRLAGGERIEASRAVLAAVSAPVLYETLLPQGGGPRVDLRRWQPDNPTVKVDWALDGPIPWTAPEARLAGTVHVADGMDGLAAATTDLTRGVLPDHPFLVLGQYSMVDATRCPPGKEVAWGYTHTPMGHRFGPGELDRFVERMEGEVERMAPGFRERILARHVADLPAGAVNHGTSQLHQQLVFRPLPGLGRPETPVRQVYLASAAAHPGGGVHGGPGSNAARAALAHDRLARTLRRVRPANGS